ncbi:hypothetical protein CsSME_00051553 [Camellia sinensis var. sinensis]
MSIMKTFRLCLDHGRDVLNRLKNLSMWYAGMIMGMFMHFTMSAAIMRRFSPLEVGYYLALCAPIMLRMGALSTNIVI